MSETTYTLEPAYPNRVKIMREREGLRETISSMAVFPEITLNDFLRLFSSTMLVYGLKESDLHLTQDDIKAVLSQLQQTS